MSFGFGVWEVWVYGDAAILYCVYANIVVILCVKIYVHVCLSIYIYTVCNIIQNMVS